MYNSKRRVIIVSTMIWKEEVMAYHSLNLEGLIINVTAKYHVAQQG
jgi:hypothetical protein